MYEIIKGINFRVSKVNSRPKKKICVFPSRNKLNFFAPTLNFLMALLKENSLNILFLPFNVVFLGLMDHYFDKINLIVTLEV